MQPRKWRNWRERESLTPPRAWEHLGVVPGNGAGAHWPRTPDGPRWEDCSKPPRAREHQSLGLRHSRRDKNEKTNETT